MGTDGEVVPLQNYFNYFTEVEEHFQKARGTSLFLLSPLDWALIESWKDSGIPLEAVLRGIDAAFEKWRSRRSKTQMVNSLAFCSQAVLTEAQRVASTEPKTSESSPFDPAEITEFLRAGLERVSRLGGYEDVVKSLTLLVSEEHTNLEHLEQRLTILEDKMLAIARSQESDEDALRWRQELDDQLQPYRRKMTAPQLAMLEKQFLQRKLLERAGLPRLSLFYLR